MMKLMGCLLSEISRFIMLENRRNERFSIKIGNQDVIKGFPQIMKILDNQIYIQNMGLFLALFR